MVKPVDHLKDPNMRVLNTKQVESTDTDLTEQATTRKVVNAAEQPLTQGECGELEPDLSRYSEFEQVTTQISDVQQGHLFT